jgi:hypothetical protein
MPKMVDERFVEMVFIFGILSFKSTDGKNAVPTDRLFLVGAL